MIGVCDVKQLKSTRCWLISIYCSIFHNFKYIKTVRPTLSKLLQSISIIEIHPFVVNNSQMHRKWLDAACNAFHTKIVQSLNKPITVHYLMQAGRGILLAHHYGDHNLPLNTFYVFVENATGAGNGFIAEGVRVCIFLKTRWKWKRLLRCDEWSVISRPLAPIMHVTAYGWLSSEGDCCLFCTYNETIDNRMRWIA